MRARVAAPAAKVERLTVAGAVDLYIQYKAQRGRDTAGIVGRARKHILPTLGPLVVAELSTDTLRHWLHGVAAAKAKRSKHTGDDDDDVRARRVTANRVLNVLRAVLNHAYNEGHVPARDAWGTRLQAYTGVERPRERYLSIDEGNRLINACCPEFRPLLIAGLQTGARLSELTRLTVADFNPDAGTVRIQKSKSGKLRQIILTPAGAAFFKQHCAGRTGAMFTRDDGAPWDKNAGGRYMAAAVAAAGITPSISFHGLRYTYTSHCVMGGVPLQVVARNLGHHDVSVLQKHYSHLSDDYIRAAIHAGAPRWDVEPSNVVPLTGRK